VSRDFLCVKICVLSLCVAYCSRAYVVCTPGGAGTPSQQDCADWKEARSPLGVCDTAEQIMAGLFTAGQDAPFVVEII
jgi:hypothetical protein